MVLELHAGAFWVVDYMTWLERGQWERHYSSTVGAAIAYHMLVGTFLKPRNSYNTDADMFGRQKADNTQHNRPPCRRVPANSQEGVAGVGRGAATSESIKLYLSSNPAAGTTA